MAQAQRKPAPLEQTPLNGTPADYAYRAGGPIADLQADLAKRLTADGHHRSPAPGERAVRFLSTGGGYLALAAGYAAAALAVAHWL